MEYKQVVGNRRAIRYFKPYQPVEPGKIQTILEAARLQCHHANIKLARKAVVLTKGETPADVFDAVVEALYSQVMAQQAPVIVVWAIDMSGWEGMREGLLELIRVHALNPTHGWSEEFVDEVVLKTPDFNVMSGDRTFAEWITAIEMGLAMGSAVLAAVDEGLGSILLTGDRPRIREILGMPDHVTPAQMQLVGYPAESPDAGGQRPRADFEQLYSAHRWGNPLRRDPEVVERLTEAGMIQPAAPLPWRRDEVRALAAMFGLPSGD